VKLAVPEPHPIARTPSEPPYIKAERIVDSLEQYLYLNVNEPDQKIDSGQLSQDPHHYLSM